MLAHLDDHEVFYTTSGQGRPMILMHGGSGLDHTYFRPWLDPLGDQVQLTYYDQYGQGRSTRPHSFEEISMESWADEADALRASLGHERILLLGHSYGGFIAQTYALRHPERLCAKVISIRLESHLKGYTLLLLNPLVKRSQTTLHTASEHLDGLILSNTAPALDYPDVIMANAQTRGTPEQVQAFITGLSAPVADDETWRRLWVTILPLYFHRYDPQVAAALDEATYYSAGAFNQGMGKIIATFNTLSQLSEITVPTLVLAGSHDWITPPAHGAERLHAGLPNSKLVLFKESGHFPFIEEQEKFIRTVREWVADL